MSNSLFPKLSISRLRVGKVAVVSNSLLMQHLLPRRLWIAIAISALAIEYSHPAIAKPKSKFTTSHIAERVTTLNSRSKQLTRQMLASSTSKQVILAKKTIRATKGVYPRRAKTNENNKSPNGLSNMTNNDPERDDRSSPVHRLIK
jgi:hypothetical protein